MQMDLIISVCCGRTVSIPVQPFEALSRVISLRDLFELLAVWLETFPAIRQQRDLFLIQHERPDEKLFRYSLGLHRNSAKWRCCRPLKACLGSRKSGISGPRKPIALPLSNDS